jgi:hypothetical protein
MILLGDLYLTSCSEIIEPVSLFNYYQEVEKKNTKTMTTW